MNLTKLSFQLVPSSCWYSNVRSAVSPSQWKGIRKNVIAHHGCKCFYCGAHPKSLDCHEIWVYDEGLINCQILADIIPLCKSCHQVCHIGLWSLKGKFDKCIRHYQKVTKKSRVEALADAELAFIEFERRSVLTWETSLNPVLASYLDEEKS
jgi:hypothetical protein